MFRKRRSVDQRWVLIAAVALIPGGAARGADFFAGKQIRVIVPAGPAGGYSLYAELAAKHLGRFIPGNPNIVVSYMPGGGGVNAMNYLYDVAPHDGTVISVVTQDLASDQALDVKGVKFDATKFNYIGRVTANVPVHMVWHTAPAKSIAEIEKRQVITGAVGSDGVQNYLPLAENALIGTKWKIVAGYRGNNETRVAMERGETQAAVSPATLFEKQLKPWLENGDVKVIVQYADFRHPLFPDVPDIVELGKTAQAKGVFKFLVSLSTVGRAYAAPPGVPAGTVRILRKAFEAMVKDPAFEADAKKRGADVLPMSGLDLSAYIKDIVATPPDLLKKANEVIGAQ